MCACGLNTCKEASHTTTILNNHDTHSYPQDYCKHDSLHGIYPSLRLETAEYNVDTNNGSAVHAPNPEWNRTGSQSLNR